MSLANMIKTYRIVIDIVKQFDKRLILRIIIRNDFLTVSKFIHIQLFRGTAWYNKTITFKFIIIMCNIKNVNWINWFIKLFGSNLSAGSVWIIGLTLAKNI